MNKGLAQEFPTDCERHRGRGRVRDLRPVRVFWAMRADNWLHAHGDLDSGRGRAVKGELLEVFRPSDPVWMRRVFEVGAWVLARARDGLAAA